MRLVISAVDNAIAATNKLLIQPVLDLFDEFVNSFFMKELGKKLVVPVPGKLNGETVYNLTFYLLILLYILIFECPYRAYKALPPPILSMVNTSLDIITLIIITAPYYFCALLYRNIPAARSFFDALNVSVKKTIDVMLISTIVSLGAIISSLKEMHKHFSTIGELFIAAIMYPFLILIGRAELNLRHYVLPEKIEDKTMPHSTKNFFAAAGFIFLSVIMTLLPESFGLYSNIFMNSAAFLSGAFIIFYFKDIVLVAAGNQPFYQRIEIEECAAKEEKIELDHKRYVANHISDLNQLATKKHIRDPLFELALLQLDNEKTGIDIYNKEAKDKFPQSVRHALHHDGYMNLSADPEFRKTYTDPSWLRQYAHSQKVKPKGFFKSLDAFQDAARKAQTTRDDYSGPKTRSRQKIQ